MTTEQLQDLKVEVLTKTKKVLDFMLENIGNYADVLPNTPAAPAPPTTPTDPEAPTLPACKEGPTVSQILIAPDRTIRVQFHGIEVFKLKASVHYGDKLVHEETIEPTSSWISLAFVPAQDFTITLDGLSCAGTHTKAYSFRK